MLHARRGPPRQGAQPGAARRRPARGRAAPHPGRRRQRQDARLDPPHRASVVRAEGPPGGDPRGHLHQQGGGRAEGARGEAGRPRRGAALGGHLPRRGCAHPAARGRGARAQPGVRHLRRRGPARGGEALVSGAGSGRGHRPAARRAHRSLEERRPVAGRGEARRLRRARPGLAEGLRALPTRPAGRQRGRLRRPDRPGDPTVPGASRRRAALRLPLPPRPGGRVPGHQPGAVPAPAHARRGARQPVRGRRR